MSTDPRGVDARMEGRVLVLTLDTPGELNVVSRPVARQLASILCEVDAEAVDAVLLRSGKRRSFVNGVGLMLAGSVKEPEDVTRLTADVRAAYRLLEELPVPTIAAIRGNCFGCGIELVLRCDHRIAADDFDTCFRMTEVADYLFVPCFGGTWDLPRLVGLPNATDLVLWGRRWSAPEAARERLVDACFPVESFGGDALQFARDVVALRRPPATRSGPGLVDGEWVHSTRERIEALPPAVRPVYSECFELMCRAATGASDASSARGRELLTAGRSVATRESRAAQGFFFVRRTAHLVSAGTEPHDRSPEHRLLAVGRNDLLAELATRRSSSVTVVPADDAADDFPGAIAVGDYDDPKGATVAVRSTPLGVPLSWPSDIVAYAPGSSQRSDLIEVAAQPHAIGTARRLCDALSRLGMVPVLTLPSNRLLIDDLVEAYVAPLIAHLEAGGDFADCAATLVAHGRLRPLGDLAALLPPGHPGRILGTAEPGNGVPAPQLLDALEVSLAAACIRALGSGAARHPAVLDVIAREALDWPLSRRSVCRSLDRSRLSDAVSRARLVPPGDRARVESFVQANRSFYA